MKDYKAINLEEKQKKAGACGKDFEPLNLTFTS